MTLRPLTAFGDAPNQITYNFRSLADQLSVTTNTQEEMGPDILRVVKHAPTAVELSFRRMRFADEVSIDGLGRQALRACPAGEFHEADFRFDSWSSISLRITKY